MENAPSLEQQRAAFCQRRFLNMPLAGMICWAVIGIGSLFLDPFGATMLVYFGAGAIIYLAMLISRFTGEPFFRRERNTFDRLFFAGLVMSLLVFSIAIPFAMVERSAVTLGVGILSGLMWMPFSWIIQHWIGYFHAVARTLLVLAGWLLFPEHHFQVVPAVIVAMYAITIPVLEHRWRRSGAAAGT